MQSVLETGKAGVARLVYRFDRAERSVDGIPVGRRFSTFVQTVPGAHPTSYTMGTGSLSRGQSGRGVAITIHTSPTPRLKKEWNFNSAQPVGLHGLFYVKVYLYL